ncbi:hypothetical protein PFDG_04940 [Plasmodium falciparum Dd2]|uniref:Uncharacterized protein n=1 Tax=Plasmodium falciparum (isolate Dd2) TaxID=57267 RepID=A0A0L7M999_PLAF4|nr:hypothetical protein PFDG_04940 [Plasmodium falciparum Dd2]
MDKDIAVNEKETDFITDSHNVDECENVILKTLRQYYKKRDEYLVKLKNEYKKMDEEKRSNMEKKNNKRKWTHNKLQQIV